MRTLVPSQKAPAPAVVQTAVQTEVQTKLTVGRPGDRYEQEADRVAAEILRMPAAAISDASPSIQRMHRHDGERDTGAPLPDLASGGEPLSAAQRSFFEPRFRHCFDAVRIHTDAAAAASAQELDALAYTRGRHVVFAPGQYEPHTERGQRLLAHELTHVVQQGAARHDSIQRSYVAPTPEESIVHEHPRPETRVIEGDETPDIQRQPAPKTPVVAPALAAPTLALTPGDTLVRGDTLNAKVAFTPTKGEKLTVTGWKYNTAADVVTRPKTDKKFQSEWAGVMALSGSLELSYTVKPKSGAAVTGTPVATAVTVNDRTGTTWQSAITDLPETPLTGKPSPPEKASELGTHVLQSSGFEPTAGESPIAGGPNNGFTFVKDVTDPGYKSEPHIHPDVLDPTSRFGGFHKGKARLYFKPDAGPRVLVPPAEYTIVSVAGGQLKFTVPNWTAFYKKYGFWKITATAGGTTIVLKDAWWILDPNTETGNAKITNDAAVIAALRLPPPVSLQITQAPNGQWHNIALLPPNQILSGTRSHEYVHATHSHRANAHKIVSALDPRRVLESAVSTPASAVAFRDKIHALVTEIRKPNHELVDEQASAAAGTFVAIPGKTMAAVNQDPATGAHLGTVWDITHDDEVTP